MLQLKKIIVHELKKDSGNPATSLLLSESLLSIEIESTDLISTLLKSYQDDKISYAEFDNSPGKYFPEQYYNYSSTSRNENDFIEFSKNVVGNLETIIRGKILARGGYLVFVEYSINSNDFITIFLIRDTEGKLLKRTSDSFEIKKIEYLDTKHLAMACRINESRIQSSDQNYLSFTNIKNQNLSDYFTDWVCIKRLESSEEFTNALYRIINSLNLPINPETNSNYSIDEVRNMVYENVKHNAQHNINLKTLSSQIYGDENIIINYADQHNISIDSEFQYNKRALKRFIQISVIKDGITLKYSRGDAGIKVRISEENQNMVIIESELFVNALKQQLTDHV